LKIRATLLMVSLLWARAGAAQQVLPLERLEAQALTRRAALEAERAQVEAAGAGVDVATSAYRPRVGVSLFLRGGSGSQLIRVRDIYGSEYLTQGSPPLGDGAFEPRLGHGAALSVAQNVYDFGRTRAAIESAEATREGARAGLEAARQRVLREVRQAYLGWLAATLSERALASSVERARQRRRRIEGRVAEGLRPPSETDAAARQELLAELELIKQRGQLAAARLALERATTAPLPPDAAPDPRVLERAPKPSTAQAPELAALRKQADAALAGARASQSGRPELNAVANAGVRGQNDLVAPYYDVTLSFSMPLWDGGAGNARASAERARADAMLAESRELSAALASERALARSEFDTSAERVNAGVRLVELAQRRLRSAEERYELGSAPLEAVLDAEDELGRAEQELEAARVARAQAALLL
jgi:outer membrane protein TolC